MDALDLPQALRQGVYENNRSLARALAEWGGPLEEGQVRAMLHHWAFGSPRPIGLNPPEPRAEGRPPWRNTSPLRRIPFAKLLPEMRARWVTRLSDEVWALAREHRRSLADYTGQRGTRGGRMVSGDTLLDLLPSMIENPPLALAALTRVAPQVRSELSALGLRIRDQALNLAGQAPILLVAGGHAVGKTTLSHQLIRRGFPGAILESPWFSEEEIHRVLDHGHEAWVVYVDRPFEEAFQSMILRAADQGCVVAPGEMAHTHAEAPQRLLQSLAPFRDQAKVSCWHLRNDALHLAPCRAIGGPLHQGGQAALASIHSGDEHTHFEAAARRGWTRFQRAILDRHQNPYPADLAHEITSKIGETSTQEGGQGDPKVP